LRNLLTGTRPQSDPFAPAISRENGDANWVLVDGARYYLPNNVADAQDVPSAFGPVRVLRSTAPVPGRWGEPHLVPGAADDPITAEFNNLIRAGQTSLRLDPETLRPVPRDADDDNFNALDPYPQGPDRHGEVGDSDLYDESGGLVLPVERMRRFVIPVDVDGS